MYLSCVLSLVDYEKKSGSLKTWWVSPRNSTELTSYVHFRAWKNLKCTPTKCTSMFLGAASYFRVGAVIAAQTHPYLRGTQSSQFAGASPVSTVIIKTSTREDKKKIADMRRDRKLCWQQHCPERHLLSVSRWICEASAQRPPPTTRPQLCLDLLFQSGTRTHLDRGVNTQSCTIIYFWICSDGCNGIKSFG